MDPRTILDLLQDPLGIPAPAWVFRGLSVLTFALHIAFVNLTVGGALLVLYGLWKWDERWIRLTRTLAFATTVFFSLAMVLGVAPLLFVQVVYEPLWYTSSVLSAAWVASFPLLLMGAYALLYLLHLRMDRLGRTGRLASAAAVVGLLFVAAAVMHALSVQALQPGAWSGWYLRGAGVEGSGGSLHAFEIARFLHFLLPAPAAIGVFLMLAAWYRTLGAPPADPYRDWTARLGAWLAAVSTGAEIVGGLAWLLALPPALRFHTDPALLAGAFLGVALFGVLLVSLHDPIPLAIPAAAVALAAALVMSAARESLRTALLAPFGYAAAAHAVRPGWEGTALFALTFPLGLVVLGYLAAVAFQAGRSRATYVEGPRIARWGRMSIALLAGWLAAVVTLGLVVTFG